MIQQKWLLLCVLPLATAGCKPAPVLFLSRPGNGTTGSAEETWRYYRNIGADNDKALSDWLDHRCYKDAPNNKRVSAWYYNGADLGLGRELSCWECPKGDPQAGLISCAVFNHGVPQGLDGFEFKLNDGSQHQAVGRQASIHGALQALTDFAAGRNMLRGASVVFDYMPGASGEVRMYIYDANDFKLFSKDNPFFEQARAAHARGDVNNPVGREQLIPGLQLDGEGGALNARVKYIRNCLSCHGGRYDERQDLIRGATFLDFDPVLFNFGNDPDPTIQLSPDPDQLTSCQKNLPALAQMSAFVTKVAAGVGAELVVERIAHNTQRDASGRLVHNFGLREIYPGGPCTPDVARAFVPKGWDRGRTVARLGDQAISDKKFFQVVVHKYCASCHFSQTPVCVPQSATNRQRVKDCLKPLTFGDAGQWFANENLVDLDALRQVLPNATSVDVIRRTVCGSSDMPHAEVTRNNMKRDPEAFAYVCNAVPVTNP